MAELEALERLSHAARQPSDEDDVLQALVTTVARDAHADVAAIVTTSGGRLEVAYRSASSGPTDAGLIAAVRSGRVASGELDVEPLPSRSTTAGALVAWRIGLPFSEPERRLMQATAAHAGTTLTAARGAMRGLLAREIHHRVKNNLQTVASLLRLAAASGSDPQRALRDSIGRVLAIAEVHDLLTETRDDDVDSADLIRRLALMLHTGLDGRTDASLLAPIVLPPERATPLALCVCELVANAIEHGGGDVTIELKRDGAFGELTVRDRGPGPAPTGAGQGQGLSIARALVESDLRGTLAFGYDEGVRAVVRFPL